MQSHTVKSISTIGAVGLLVEPVVHWPCSACMAQVAAAGQLQRVGSDESLLTVRLHWSVGGACWGAFVQYY